LTRLLAKTVGLAAFLAKSCMDVDEKPETMSNPPPPSGVFVAELLQ
jgi:hypothetical protein